MSSLKMTFSLASLILILGLVFSVMPVVAHDLVPGETGDQHVAGTTIPNHNTHAIVQSVTLQGDAADGYVNTRGFNIAVTFSSTGGTPTDFGSTNINVSADGWTARDVSGSGLSYTALILPPSNATSDTLNVVISITGNTAVAGVTGAQAIYSQPNADGPDPDTNPDTGPAADRANPTKAVVSLDVTGPKFGDGGDRDLSGDPPVYGGAAPSIHPLQGNRAPLNGGWSDAFEFRFQIVAPTGTVANVTDMSVDLTTFMFTAAPNTVTFSDAGGTGSNNTYGVTVTPKTVTQTETSATAVTLTVKVTDKAGNTGMTTHIVNLKARTGTGTGTTPTTPTTPSTDNLTGLTVPAKSYVVLVHNKGTTSTKLTNMEAGLPASFPTVSSPASATTTQVWEGMPNLEDLLFRGGSIVLTRVEAAADALFDHDGDDVNKDGKKDSDTTKDASAPRQYQARDLIITEVMAAVNTAKVGQVGYLYHQWVEIYNPLSVPVTNVTVRSKYGRPAADAESGQVLLDRLSNVVGGGWKFTGLGQNGFDDDVADDTTTTSINEANAGRPNVDFKSFYRDERGKDGHTMGHWATSTNVYYSEHYGTPGASERTSAPTIGADTVSLKPAIINEVANYPTASKKYEWIEIMVTDGTHRFKNWEVEIITAAKTIKRVFTLPEIPDARKISKDGILLVTNSDPAGDEDHPLAAGYNVMKNNANQANGVGPGHAVSYIVRSFDNELPDDGNFVLTLRTTNDKDNHEGIVDIAGYHDNLKVDEAGFFTNLWPLRNYSAPVIKDGRSNALPKETVHRRQHTDIVGTGTSHGDTKVEHLAMRDIGWTGIGYKRNADATAQNGGTPGYPNDAIQSEGMKATESVIISEIMYDTSRNLPQWIELQNMSNTVGVDINNWSLFLANHNLTAADGGEYTGGKLSERIDLDGKIPPGQTFLIVSNGSRHNTRLPSERIHNLRKGRGPKLLNPYGFRIELKAKTNEGDANKHQLVDDVGNLPNKPENSRRTDAQSFLDPLWALPSGADDDGNRVSIARRTKIMAKGTAMAAWVRTDMDMRTDRVSETYYGHNTDISSPGATVGSVLPVSLSKFRPERLESGEIVIRWITESELNNAGFNILRSEKRDGQFTKINTSLIKGQGTTSERTTYSLVDKSAKPNVVYYYQIQDVSLDGQVQTLRQSRLKGDVSPAGKLTTIWGEIKALQ